MIITGHSGIFNVCEDINIIVTNESFGRELMSLNRKYLILVPSQAKKTTNRLNFSLNAIAEATNREGGCQYVGNDINCQCVCK